jgi:cellulose synthase/poly-beta-1,6-N-acetylglucosamine synthase-like glycosyltransferase
MQILFLLSSLLMFAYILLLLLYRKQWLKVDDFVINHNTNQEKIFISVIVPARNEEKNIIALLETLKKQSYPSGLFEVLVIDDFSTDKTAELVFNYQVENIKLISLRDFVEENSINSYKKKAIEVGIESSRGELIVTTDADCLVNKNWLFTIASFYDKHKPEMIVMPVSITHTSSLISLFQTIDFMCLQGITAAAVSNNFHGMCNGANLAYTKKGFYEVDGFKDINHIASGDDMMLMHKMAQKNKSAIKYLKSEDVIVETQPVNSVSEFFNQRIRWASKANKYQDKNLFPVLLLVYLVNLLLLILLVAVVFIPLTSNYFAVLGLLVIGKIIFEYYFLYPVSRFFKKQNTLWIFPLLQPLHIIYTVTVGGMGKFGFYQWKGRKVK